MIDYASIAAEIKGLSADSRTVKDGYLFAALSGAQVDGRDFIGQALEAGASVVLAEAGCEVLMVCAWLQLIMHGKLSRI